MERRVNMTWYTFAKRIKDYIVLHGNKYFDINTRLKIIKEFYSCKNESDYKLFSLNYNQAILNVLL